ncbi:MAG: hypothetical protein HYY30_01130 [Chloroflexi bacterium]|nr:hypothetical protein [Chloroflexota bacterium]
MQPNESMEQVIGRVRYRVADSILIADDEYWDGHNFERHGRNTFLYRTPKGRYFAVHLTRWQGEWDRIEPLDEDAAYELYEDLPEKQVDVSEAFPSMAIEEA